MKSKVIALAASSLLAAGSARATTMVAGWDFSQYANGFLADGASFNEGPDVLASNFSDLDPGGSQTNQLAGLGNGSEAFGSWYIDGQFGSTDTVLDGSFVDPFRPAGGSLSSNDDAPGITPFSFNSSQTSLLTDGQPSWENVAMNFDGAGAVLSSVFEATLQSLGAVTGSGWSIAFGGQAQTDAGFQSGAIGVSVSFDGGLNFNPVGVASLTGLDTRFEFQLGGTDVDRLLVRLDADGGTRIDNVSLEVLSISAVPEPGAALLGLVGLAGLAWVARPRRA
jgi:hypothetical protein